MTLVEIKNGLIVVEDDPTAKPSVRCQHNPATRCSSSPPCSIWYDQYRQLLFYKMRSYLLFAPVLLCSAQYRCQTKVNPKLQATFSVAGATGSITAVYPDTANPSHATISVDLNLQSFQPIKLPTGCTFGPTSEFAWHLHENWNNTETSSIDKCGFDQTGNHIDPTFACGPASQFINSTVCQSRTSPYSCSPDVAATGCELGDFSGKFGKLKANGGRIQATFTDQNFPSLSTFNQPFQTAKNTGWNFILHLSCPNNQFPRVLCAQAQRRD